METKKEYTAPQLTAVNVKSERGYAASTPLTSIFLWDNSWGTSQQLEDYSVKSGWTDDGSNSFWD